MDIWRFEVPGWPASLKQWPMCCLPPGSKACYPCFNSSSKATFWHPDDWPCSIPAQIRSAPRAKGKTFAVETPGLADIFLSADHPNMTFNKQTW